MSGPDPFAAPEAELGRADERLRHFGEATRGMRLVNFLVDLVALNIWQLVLTLPVYALAGEDVAAYQWPILAIAHLSYYLVLEGLFGRTLGKLVTGTRVVRLADGQPPTWRQLLGRTAARWVPFEPVSFLSGERGWHDDWSETQVVRVRG